MLLEVKIPIPNFSGIAYERPLSTTFESCLVAYLTPPGALHPYWQFVTKQVLRAERDHCVHKWYLSDMYTHSVSVHDMGHGSPSLHMPSAHFFSPHPFSELHASWCTKQKTIRIPVSHFYHVLSPILQPK